MNTVLATTVLLMGLAGAPHCAAMCGAACTGVVHGCSGASTRAGLIGFHAGRLVGYAAGGAFAAGSVSWLARQGAQVVVLRPMWIMLQVAAIVLGLWLLVRGRQPAWIEALDQRIHRPPRTGKVIWIGAPVRAGAAGAAWVAWPCGLLQSALFVAALGSGAVDGALLMGLFGAASALGLWLGPALWMRLAGPRGGSMQMLAVRLAGLSLAVASIWAVWHGVVGALGQDFCLPIN
jgi:uncharacterized protein